YFGFALPNTAVAKLGHGIPRSDVLAQGLAYLHNSVTEDPVTALTFALAIAFALANASPRSLLPLAGAALHLAYVVRVGGDFMSGRMVASALVVAAITLARTLPARDWVGAVVGAGLLGVAMLAPHPSLTSGSDFGDGRQVWGDLVDLDGIADERAFWFHCSGWVSDRRPPGPFDCGGQRALVDKYLAAGKTVIEAGGVGFLGYWAGDRLTIVDDLGIADPLMARIPSPARERAVWRPGHYPRPLPKGYLESLRTGEDHFADRELGELYAALALVATAPLLDGARLDAVMGFHLGRYDALSPEVQPDEPMPPQPLPSPDPRVRVGRRCHQSHMWSFRRGWAFTLPRPSEAHGLWLTVNEGAEWTIRLTRGEAVVADLVVDVVEGARIRRTCIRVPAGAAEAGYDGMRVQPIRGDHACFGGIELVDACP
ncbi:MAG: hypothetical protein KC621_10415, partial [Myxococcales bacterium]|nr:hypothetical protein [Myxococcales bacterium]